MAILWPLKPLEVKPYPPDNSDRNEWAKAKGVKVSPIVRWAQYKPLTISAHPDNHEKIKAFAAGLEGK